MSTRPPQFEGAMQKIARKSKEQPLVPLGVLVTCGALIGAQVGIRKADRNLTQHMFRLRVAAQGFTVLACIAGSVYYERQRRQERWEKKQAEQSRAVVATTTTDGTA